MEDEPGRAWKSGEEPCDSQGLGSSGGLKNRVRPLLHLGLFGRMLLFRNLGSGDDPDWLGKSDRKKFHWIILIG